MPLGFIPRTLQNQGFPLSMSKRFPLNQPSLLLPLLLQLRVLISLQTLHLRVHRRSTNPGPLPVHPVRPKRRVLGLSQPDRPHRGAALRVAEPEVERQVGTNRLAAGSVERRGGTVLGLRLLSVGLGGSVIEVLGFGGEGGRWFEGVAVVEFGSGGGGEVAREERDDGGGILAGEAS